MDFHTFITQARRMVQMVMAALVVGGALLLVPGPQAHADSWSESQQGVDCAYANLSGNDPGIYIYEKDNYQGECGYFRPNSGGFGRYTTHTLINSIGNDSASSIRFVNPTGADWTVTVYEDDNWQGPFIVLDHSMATFWQLRFNDGKSLNDNISSIRIRYEHKQGSSCVDVPNTSPGVYLYSDINYGGDCSYFSPTGTAFEKYNSDVINYDYAVGNDRASSIRVVNPTGANWTVTLYENKDWQGPFINFDEDLPTFLPTLFNDAKHLNDNVSSITIQWQ